MSFEAIYSDGSYWYSSSYHIKTRKEAIEAFRNDAWSNCTECSIEDIREVYIFDSENNVDLSEILDGYNEHLENQERLESLSEAYGVTLDSEEDEYIFHLKRAKELGLKLGVIDSSVSQLVEDIPSKEKRNKATKKKISKK